MMYKKDPKFLTQVQYCEQQAVPLMVVVGEEEMKNGGVKLRDVKTQKEVRKKMRCHAFSNISQCVGIH